MFSGGQRASRRGGFACFGNGLVGSRLVPRREPTNPHQGYA